MKFPTELRVTRIWTVGLAAVVLFAVSIPLGSPASAQKSRADQCSETLQKNYGVSELSGVDQHNASNRRSVYATGTLANGSTVRFRCLMGERDKPEVQVYAPSSAGGSTSWSKWGSADAYRVPPKEDEPEASPEQDKSAEAPQEPEEPQGPKTVRP